MASPGIYGKHPGFGDFISAGLPALAESHMVPWWTELLSATRDWMGDGWDAAWDTALPIRFWIGGAIWGGAHLRGVARASHDKVGRRFPLIAVAETAGSPPMLESDQGFYRAVEMELAADLPSAEDLRGRLAARTGQANAAGPVDAAVSATFWAANPALDVAELLTQLDVTDRVRAVGARSYWWVAAGENRASAVLACDGLPQPGEMAWLLAGVQADMLTATKARAESPGINADSEGGDAGR
ncbi:type VI secretion system-associated protein TagF [Paracoccus tegillarcae]|uniref:Type VI secretion system-associated protein TagF n=1 Tax=Paracoccus tegillarcae TaxID=1529068 RepID=A0A2K9EZI9_9RHOB|nr:type VI secretion system-associated protein TagF [Paracoccus tegillarcae]AUH33522.1 type VI secretion system-associated protein TagF [Paracoccus tegillarcae]